MSPIDLRVFKTKGQLQILIGDKTFSEAEIEAQGVILANNLELIGLNLDQLPKWVSNVHVSGTFNCSFNKLTSLENSPFYVAGDFFCNDNKLTTLKGATPTIGKSFFCDHNRLTSLEGSPRSIGSSFICFQNRLISIVGLPEQIGEHFITYEQPRQFSEVEIRSRSKINGGVLTTKRKIDTLFTILMLIKKVVLSPIFFLLRIIITVVYFLYSLILEIYVQIRLRIEVKRIRRSINKD